VEGDLRESEERTSRSDDIKVKRGLVEMVHGLRDIRPVDLSRHRLQGMSRDPLCRFEVKGVINMECLVQVYGCANKPDKQINSKTDLFFKGSGCDNDKTSK